ncbi:hypothetical protein D1871_06780 [Nakamurella silvestris]|nr:hypothetical protein D1871_06780 [Nakamurella silvestris]
MTEQNRPTFPVGLLVVAALLWTLAPTVGVVTSADGSSTDPLLPTSWLNLLPAVLAVALLLIRPRWAWSAAAGIGLVGASRLVGDLGVLSDPGTALRPELFSVTSVNATPLAASTGVWFLIVADLLCLLAVVLTAGNVFATLPELTDNGYGRPRLARSPWVLTVGLIGVALSIGSMFSALYTGIAPAPGLIKNLDVGISALGSGALLGLAVMLAVILAASLPRAESIGLLIGAGVTMAVAPLAAILAPLFDDSAGPSFVAWLALLAAVLVAGAGFAQRDEVDPQPQEDPQVLAAPTADRELRPLAAFWTYVPSALALIAGVLTVIAARSQQATQLNIVLIRIAFPDPVARTAQEVAISAPAGQGLPAAAVLLFAAAVLAAIPRAGVLGRLSVIAAGAASIAATAYGFDYLGAMNLSTFQQLGQGLWKATTGLTLGAVAAVVALLAVIAVLVRDGRNSELTEESEHDFAGDQPWDERNPWPLWIASGLTVLAVLAYAGPAFRTFQHGDGPRLLGSIRMQDYGAVLGLVATLILLWWAARTVNGGRRARGFEVIGSLLLAAVLVAGRIVLPSSVRELTDFSLRWGYPISIALVVGLLLAVPGSWWWLRGAPDQAPVRDRVGNLTTGRDAEDRLT